MNAQWTYVTGEMISDKQNWQQDTPTHPTLGLSEREALNRRKRGLGNEVKLKTSRSYLEILRTNLFTFFNLVLIVLGIALILLGRPVEAVITSGVVLINMFVSMIQEIRAKHKLDHIALLTYPRSSVIRDGVEKQVDPNEIVQGDVLVLNSGDQIVVDGIVVSDGQLIVDESLISGEADLIRKQRGSQIYSGSFCTAGKGRYLAQKVGAESLANELTAGARSFTSQYTPLQREVNLIIRALLGVVLFFLALYAIKAFMGEISLVESVRAASVLFGLAPSSLFLMIVVAYTWGAVRIAGKGALVQQANSVESLCNVTVLCLDKTGTLTTNRIQLTEIMAIDKDLARSLNPDIHQILGTYAFNLTSTTRTSKAISDSLPGKRLSPYEEVLFNSKLGWSALSFNEERYHGTFVLGTPENLIPNLVSRKRSIADDPKTIETWIKTRTERGLRVLMFAFLPYVQPLHDKNEIPQLPERLEPLCMLCFSDELRSGVKETIDKFEEVGIRLKIISGDSPDTVVSLARQAGLGKPGKELRSVSGRELVKMDDATFIQATLEVDIFGRVTPQMKEKLVTTLREQGNYVAMTGDGVNDVMALKQADLGIAMQSGSSATRNVAGMVLLNDSFSVLPQAFSEGQRILNGLQDIMRLYLTRILYFALLIAALGWLGNGSPFTPKQNSLISLLTLSIPAFALALWSRPGPIPKESLTRRLLHFVIPGALTCAATGLIVYIYFIISTGDKSYAQSVLTYTMILIGILLLVFVEPPTRIWVSGEALSGDWRPTILAVLLFSLFMAVFAVPYIRDLYDLVLLRSVFDYLIVGIVVVSWAVVVRFVWRLHLLDKYLNVDLGGPS